MGTLLCLLSLSATINTRTPEAARPSGDATTGISPTTPPSAPFPARIPLGHPVRTLEREWNYITPPPPPPPLSRVRAAHLFSRLPRVVWSDSLPPPFMTHLKEARLPTPSAIQRVPIGLSSIRRSPAHIDDLAINPRNWSISDRLRFLLRMDLCSLGKSDSLSQASFALARSSLNPNNGCPRTR